MTIGDAAKDAMPLLVRGRILDAVRQAQAEAQGPATAAEVLVKLGAPPLARSPRALTALLHRVAATGADESGRRLAGDVDRLSVWRWVVEGGDPRDTEIAKRATALASPGEDLHAVLLRALDALERSAPAPVAPPPTRARRALPHDFNRFVSNGEDCEVRGPAEPLTHKLPIEHPDAREGRFWSDGSDVEFRSAPAPASPTTPRPEERRTSTIEEIPTIDTPPEPRPATPQETSRAVEPAADQQSATAPEATAPSTPAGPLYAALANVRAMRGSK